MGIRSSKQSAVERNKKETIKKLVTHNIKSKLQNIRDNIEHFVENDKAMINIDSRIVNSNIYVIDTAMKQLDRGGKNLIKADLVAIIITLKPNYITMIRELQEKMTVDDLNTLIRNIIYDPEFILTQLPAEIDNKIYKSNINSELKNSNVDLIM